MEIETIKIEITEEQRKELKENIDLQNQYKIKIGDLILTILKMYPGFMEVEKQYNYIIQKIKKEHKLDEKQQFSINLIEGK